MTKKINRNEPCPCGSGKKYKQCCIGLPEPRKHRFKAVVLSKPKQEQALPQLPNLMDRTFGDVAQEVLPQDNLLVTESFPENTPPPEGFFSDLEVPKI